MPLPTREELLKMDVSYNGEPFVQLSSAKTADLNTLDFSYKAEPFWGVNWKLVSFFLAFIMRRR